MSLAIRQVALDSPEYAQCLALRERVLRIPLGLRITGQDLALDRESFHLAAFADDAVAGSVSLKPLGQEMKLRQMAVSPERQQQKIGRQLVSAAEAFTRDRGIARMVLSARLTAAGFYEKLGYATEGEPYSEQGIPHIRMTKTL